MLKAAGQNGSATTSGRTQWTRLRISGDPNRLPRGRGGPKASCQWRAATRAGGQEYLDNAISKEERNGLASALFQVERARLALGMVSRGYATAPPISA